MALLVGHWLDGKAGYRKNFVCIELSNVKTEQICPPKQFKKPALETGLFLFSFNKEGQGLCMSRFGIM